MKKIALALIVASSNVTADLWYEDNAVLIDSNETKRVAMAVRLESKWDCIPQVQIHAMKNITVADNFPIDFTIRVDKQDIWEATGDAILVPDIGESVFVEATPEFISQLRRGRTVRFKFPLKGGGYEYNSFPLQGFSVAYSKAKAACKPNSQYFESSNGNELYL